MRYAVAALAVTVVAMSFPGTTVDAARQGCRHASAPAPKRVRFDSPRRVVDLTKSLTAVVQTSCGNFRIALAAKRAPQTVNSFAFLAKVGFYDGLTFHRSVPGFVIQGGDPNGNGTGGPGYGVTEAPPSDLLYERGIVGMAKSVSQAPGRSGSQFWLGTATEEPRQTVLIETIAVRQG